MVELLIPELQRRGLFWNDYDVPGGTYRENLYGRRGQTEPPAEHPAGKLIWRAPVQQVGFADDSGRNRADGLRDFVKPLEPSALIDPSAMQLG